MIGLMMRFLDANRLGRPTQPLFRVCCCVWDCSVLETVPTLRKKFSTPINERCCFDSKGGLSGNDPVASHEARRGSTPLLYDPKSREPVSRIVEKLEMSGSPNLLNCSSSLRSGRLLAGNRYLTQSASDIVAKRSWSCRRRKGSLVVDGKLSCNTARKRPPATIAVWQDSGLAISSSSVPMASASVSTNVQEEVNPQSWFRDFVWSTKLLVFFYSNRKGQAKCMKNLSINLHVNK